MDTQDLSIAEMGRHAARRQRHLRNARARCTRTCIGTRDSTLHAFVLVTEDRALAGCPPRRYRRMKAGDDRGPFHGIPYALKDIYDTAGIRTTCHSKLRLDVVPKEDSVAAARLREAGGVLLGKLATHEFAIGGPSFDLPFPPARNPWNPDHITGGSSSGSGTAIGARMVRMAMGSDTGGSIRGPAAWCGTVGIKATYGRVSRRGVFPLSWTLDHIGPLAAAWRMPQSRCRCWPGTIRRTPPAPMFRVPNYRADLEKGVAGLRIGIPRAFFATRQGHHARSRLRRIDRTVRQLREAGAVVEDIELPDYALFAAVGRIIMMAEAFAIHEADMQTRLLDYGELTAGRFILGAAITAADLIHALRARRELTDAVNRGAVALRCASDTVRARLRRRDLISRRMRCRRHRRSRPSRSMSPAIPAMSVPTGLGANGLPIGVQIVGRPFDEPMVFRIGRAMEKLSGWDSVKLPGG